VDLYLPPPPPPRKSCRFRDNMTKTGPARQATYGNIIWPMRFACWISKVIDTHIEHVILVFAQQLWSHERTSVLLLYAQCLVCSDWKLVQYLADILGIAQ